MVSIRWWLELVRECHQVGRPSMSLMTAFVYLYNNKNPSLWMTLYFGFIFQLGANAGNDYMDWERDRAHEEHGTRKTDESRGKARNKNYVWRYYMFATLIAFLAGWYMDRFFGMQYFVIVELLGQWAYNGVFLGFPMNELSFFKTYGFPLDIVVAAWTYTPFPYLVAQKRWTPDLTIFAWGATMVWGQLKDYQFEKDTNVKTTATFLGEFWCAVFVSVSALVMIYQDLRFLPYGLYTVYRCYMYLYVGDHKAKGKMSAAMGLNLVAIVWCDTNIPARIKVTSFLAHVLAYAANKLYPSMVQRYYALMGLINRNRPYGPYDREVWDEKDANILLWKVGSLIDRSGASSLIDRSGSAVQSLFGFEYARLCLMGYIYYRTQDTWANVCMDKEDRINGLARLPKRLEGLLSKDPETNRAPGIPDDNQERRVRWDYESRDRNRLYVDVTEKVHRFDKVFLSMKSHQQQILLRYVNDLAQGWIELEKLKDGPVTAEIMRKHAEVALDTGFYGLCRGILPEMLEVIDPASKSKDEAVCASYVSFSSFIWYMNLAATIEDDVLEGVALDEELRYMRDGALEPEVINKVRIRWLGLALSSIGQSEVFLSHPLLVDSWSLRFFVLQFLKVSLDVCEKLMVEAKGDKYTKPGPQAIGHTFLSSRSPNEYDIAIHNALDRSTEYLKQVKILEKQIINNELGK